MEKIVKAEILWTRKCPLRCSYCAMPTGDGNTQDLKFWKRAFDNLKDLGCRFAAFYGAEPLYDEISFKKLGDVLEYCSQIGIDTTVITSGMVKDFQKKMRYLHRKGLRSLTMSYDIVSEDKSSIAKSKRALERLLWFKKLGVRDVANVVTLTRLNYKFLPQHIKRMSELGIWTFFDMIHDDRGQPGSKCRHTPMTLDLMFKEEDYEELGNTLREVAKMKGEGYLCNTSLPFIELMEKDNYAHIRRYDWHCAKCEQFPSWVSIDSNGLVYPCDDYHEKGIKFMADSLYENFDKFTEVYKEKALLNCPGCLWNTHIDATFIKAGVLKGYGVEDAKNGK